MGLCVRSCGCEELPQNTVHIIPFRLQPPVELMSALRVYFRVMTVFSVMLLDLEWESRWNVNSDTCGNEQLLLLNRLAWSRIQVTVQGLVTFINYQILNSHSNRIILKRLSFLWLYNVLFFHLNHSCLIKTSPHVNSFIIIQSLPKLPWYRATECYFSFPLEKGAKNAILPYGTWIYQNAQQILLPFKKLFPSMTCFCLPKR